jgi:PadR family transcriptional regulator PadR
MDINQILENFSLELRRGMITLAVLSQLNQEQYGYSLMKNLADAGITVDQGTLYPLLRRLESQGLLDSVWRVEDERPRRYYVLNPNGDKILQQLVSEWETMTEKIKEMIG